MGDNAHAAKKDALDAHTEAQNEQAAAELASNEAHSKKDSLTRELGALKSRKVDFEQKIPVAQTKSDDAALKEKEANDILKNAQSQLQEVKMKTEELEGALTSARTQHKTSEEDASSD